MRLELVNCAEKYLSGVSLRELGRQYGVSHQTVKRWLEDSGIALRRRGRRLGHRVRNEEEPSHAE